jgi:hypothetical protein
VQIAEVSNLTKAAENLDLSISAASRYLLALEERLGIDFRYAPLTTDGAWRCNT